MDFCSNVASRCAKAIATRMKHYPASHRWLVQAVGAVLVLLAELKQELEQLAEKIDSC